MKKLLIILAALVVVTVVAIVAMGNRNRNYLKQFEGLKVPRITSMPDRKMLVIETTGDPGVAGKGVFKQLFGTYFKLKRTEKGMKYAAPKARWQGDWNGPKEQWKGAWGLAVPDSVASLPEQKDSRVVLKTWKYGEVAEILHIGAYGDETPTIEKLHKFIKDNGYVIAGDHEEEYLKGPGMFSKGNPKKYYTIIRYQVKKAGKK